MSPTPGRPKVGEPLSEGGAQCQGAPLSPTRRALLAATALGLLARRVEAQELPKLGVAAAREAVSTGRALLIDIREPDEHAGGIAPGALRLPLSQLRQRLAEIPKDPARPVLLICRTQNRSSRLAKLLREQGYSNISYVDGGMNEWQQRGYPTEKPP